jgi:hypothetical protein
VVPTVIMGKIKKLKLDQVVTLDQAWCLGFYFTRSQTVMTTWMVTLGTSSQVSLHTTTTTIIRNSMPLIHWLIGKGLPIINLHHHLHMSIFRLNFLG